MFSLTQAAASKIAKVCYPRGSLHPPVAWGVHVAVTSLALSLCCKCLLPGGDAPAFGARNKGVCVMKPNGTRTLRQLRAVLGRRGQMWSRTTLCPARHDHNTRLVSRCRAEHMRKDCLVHTRGQRPRSLADLRHTALSLNLGLVSHSSFHAITGLLSHAHETQMSACAPPCCERCKPLSSCPFDHRFAF